MTKRNLRLLPYARVPDGRVPPDVRRLPRAREGEAYERCRFGHQTPKPTGAHRRWWLERFSVDKIRALAAMIGPAAKVTGPHPRTLAAVDTQRALGGSRPVVVGSRTVF